jgi:small subunit ribosomal protein S13
MFATRQDVQFEKDTRTWRGWRHTMGQRVRGQHSRTTGRTGSSVGGLKKALKPQKAAGADKAKDSGKDKK